MPNMGSIIKSHNTKVLTPPHECEECECRDECPVNGECMKSNVIYQATITEDSGQLHNYSGLSMNKFKERLTQQQFQELQPHS